MIFRRCISQVLIPILRENYLWMYFTLTNYPFPRSDLVQSVFNIDYETLFEDLATRYKGIDIIQTPH